MITLINTGESTFKLMQDDKTFREFTFIDFDTSSDGDNDDNTIHIKTNLGVMALSLLELTQFESLNALKNYINQ